jgi:hypothetical protein
MELMQNVKQSSEATLRMVEWTLFVLENTLTVIFVSLVMVIAGCVMYYNEAAPQKKAKAAPAAKRKRRK